MRMMMTTTAGFSGGGDEDYDDMFELRIVPKDTAGLDEMFRVLCECAAMNPDDDDDDDDGGDRRRLLLRRGR